MVLFFTIVLGLSIVGMLSMLMLKRYELTTGRVVLSSVRPALSSFLATTALWIEKVLPALVRVYVTRALRALSVLAHRFIAQSVLWFEYHLEKVLHTVREKTSPSREPGEASAFLREVADHKKKLLKRDARSFEE